MHDFVELGLVGRFLPVELEQPLLEHLENTGYQVVVLVQLALLLESVTSVHY